MDDSPFPRLPSELRILIWSFSLQQSTPFLVKHSMLWPERQRSTKSSTNPMTLTQTCKTIHTESNAVFYSVNIFLIKGRNTATTFGHFTAFLQKIGPEKASYLRRVILDIGTLNLDSFEEVFSAFREWTIFLTRLQAQALSSRDYQREHPNDDQEYRRPTCEFVARATFAFLYPMRDHSGYCFDVEFGPDGRLERSWEENMKRIELLMVDDMQYWTRLRPMFDDVLENLRVVGS